MKETTKARQGEEIDVERLSKFLGSALPDRDGVVSVEQFPAGSSNLTYLVTTHSEEFVLRRPPFGNTVRTAHDMKREFETLTKLALVYTPAPRPVLFCDDSTVIGSEFYLMERRSGLIIRGRSPSELDASPELRKRVCESFIENLANLHALDYAAAGLSGLGRPEGYTRRQVEGWTKRYFAAKTDEWPELESSISWLVSNIPTSGGAALVHNDYKFDNIVLDPADLTRISAVLDWEMVTIGDPLMDLGTTLGYWMSTEYGDEMLDMPFNPRVLMENVSRGELADMYAAATGRGISDIFFYYTFGTFKIAVIAQQIYFRYVRGFTHDERFAEFNTFVAALGRIAARSIHRKSI